MAPEKGAEQPLQTWARYRADITQWYKEMEAYGLTQEEIDWLSKSDAATDGIVESQEGLMLLVQELKLGGNSLTFADKCRKGIAKKQGSLFEECEKEFFKNIKEKGCSETLAHYVWDVLLKMQRGYSFNRLLWPVQA
jgi:DNA polymerase-3 subunit alpha